MNSELRIKRANKSKRESFGLNSFFDTNVCPNVLHDDITNTNEVFFH